MRSRLTLERRSFMQSFCRLTQEQVLTRALFSVGVKGCPKIGRVLAKSRLM